MEARGARWGRWVCLPQRSERAAMKVAGGGRMTRCGKICGCDRWGEAGGRTGGGPGVGIDPGAKYGASWVERQFQRCRRLGAATLDSRGCTPQATVIRRYSMQWLWVCGGACHLKNVSFLRRLRRGLIGSRSAHYTAQSVCLLQSAARTNRSEYLGVARVPSNRTADDGDQPPLARRRSWRCRRSREHKPITPRQISRLSYGFPLYRARMCDRHWLQAPLQYRYSTVAAIDAPRLRRPPQPSPSRRRNTDLRLTRKRRRPVLAPAFRSAMRRLYCTARHGNQ